jgi:hypothetical protein
MKRTSTSRRPQNAEEETDDVNNELCRQGKIRKAKEFHAALHSSSHLLL